MSQCYAFTKTGKGCRNYARIVSQTPECITYDLFCSKHANLTKDDLWAMIRKNSLNLDFHENRRNRIKILLSKNKVSKDMFRGCQDQNLLAWPFGARPRDLACFFQLLMEHTPNAERSWFAPSPLWRGCVYILWYWSRAMGPLLVDWRHLQSVICLKDDPLAFYEGIGRRVAPPAELYTPDLWRQFLWNCCRERPDWFSSFIGANGHEEAVKTFILDKQDVHQSIKDLFLTSDFQSWLSDFKQEHYKRLKGNIAPYKERLIAATWETNRHIRWCLDEQDKAELRSWWPDADPNNPADYCVN